jgi:hypothetical protein
MFVSGLASKPLWRFVIGLASKPAGFKIKSEKTTGTVFFDLTLKPATTVFSGLASKPVVTISPGLTSKPVVEGFLVCASNPTATVWWFGSQNHCDGFLIWDSKLSGLRFVGCVTKLMGGWRRRGTHIEI